jgi:hypothetical protein
MVKTYKHLYPQICSFANLYRAHRQARRGGKRKQPEVAAFEHELGENLLRLQKELRTQSFAPSPRLGGVIREPAIQHITRVQDHDIQTTAPS